MKNEITKKNKKESILDTSSDTKFKNDLELPVYEGVITRLLYDYERSFPSNEKCFPLVLESKSDKSTQFLKSFFEKHSERLKDDVCQFGGVLFRGFDVKTSNEFESIVLSNRLFEAIDGYFMSEAGRLLVPDTKHVFYTNVLINTSFLFGMIHPENYYSPDVPSVQAFCCLNPPKMGGETAIFHMANAYGKLSESLKDKFESQSFCSAVWPLSKVSKYYGFKEELMEKFCQDNGLLIKSKGGEKYVYLKKPSVIWNPKTQNKSLHLHFFTELEKLDRLVLKRFLKYYTGWKWAFHRIIWKNKLIMMIAVFLSSLPNIIKSPKEFFKIVKQGINSAANLPKKLDLPKLSQVLTKEDIKEVSEAIVDHSSVFSWQKGDFMIIDNRQTAHSSMPGYGHKDRVIRVLLCNPIPFHHPIATGIFRIPDNIPEYKTVFEKLMAFRQKNNLAN